MNVISRAIYAPLSWQIISFSFPYNHLYLFIIYTSHTHARTHTQFLATIWLAAAVNAAYAQLYLLTIY